MLSPTLLRRHYPQHLVCLETAIEFQSSSDKLDVEDCGAEEVLEKASDVASVTQSTENLGVKKSKKRRKRTKKKAIEDLKKMEPPQDMEETEQRESNAKGKITQVWRVKQADVIPRKMKQV